MSEKKHPGLYDRGALTAPPRPTAINRTEDAAVVLACQQAIQKSRALLLRTPNVMMTGSTAIEADHPGEDLLQLFYCSRIPPLKSPQQIQDDIDNIVRVSRKENSKFGITGVLVTDRNMYSQLIEGPSRSIKDLIGRISCDIRHQDIKIISRNSSKRRLFANWSMAFIPTTRDLEVQDYRFPTETKARRP